ncbi:MAG: hypothetical protein ACYSWP_11705 [Planctomycetota bacterium]|jgi:hypothetical protein
MSDWEISRSAGECFGTGEQIEYGQEYFAALVEGQEGLVRRDFCSDYWEREKPEVFCYWKTKLPEPGKKKELFVDEEMLVSFFERLAQEMEPEKVNFRFVLALILMRKRRLKYDSTKNQGGNEIWRLRVVGGDKNFVEVLNPQLDEEQISELSSQVGEILQVEL